MENETNESSIPASYSLLDTDERIIIDLSRQCRLQRQEIARLNFEVVRHRRDAQTANEAYEKAERKHLQDISDWENERMIHRHTLKENETMFGVLGRRLERLKKRKRSR